MAHDVFLSYSSKDKATADAVCATLEKRGIRCWIAPRDIRPGLDWRGAIIDAINKARLMVLIYSGQANKSQQIDKGRRQSRPLRFSFEVAKPETRKPSTKQRWQIDLPHFKLNVK